MIIQSQDRLTVIAPHPDDETLGVGGTIWQARQMNIPVSIIFLTNGDGNRFGVAQHYHRLRPQAGQYRAYGNLRQQEAIRAATTLGVEAGALFFLGLPDQGLPRLLRPRYYNQPYRSRFTRVSVAPYPLAAMPELAYTGAAAVQALINLLTDLHPTHLLVPLGEDTHTDHQAAYQLAVRAQAHLVTPPLLYAYPVHFPAFPTPHGIHSSLRLDPPRRHARQDWQIVPLHKAAVQAKMHAVAAYQTQLQIPLLGRLMHSLIRQNELLLPL